MERLTMRSERGNVLIPINPGETDTVELAFEKLADYEDTGLMPEEIERILYAYGRGQQKESEKDGQA